KERADTLKKGKEETGPGDHALSLACIAWRQFGQRTFRFRWFYWSNWHPKDLLESERTGLPMICTRGISFSVAQPNQPDCRAVD
ncbi:MAG TPA: hypothetical protein VK798_02070, partial [Alloacidobacterium sp.]|nr:hypothetical protein [Alloacidobacterium sp.]